MNLGDLMNRTLHLLREPSGDTGDIIPTIGDFSGPTVTRDLNIALAVFISRTGLAPMISDKVATLPIVAGLDYTLPSDLAALARVEYLQTAGGLSYPYPLTMYSMADWDRLTGDGGAIPEVGAPYSFREPYAGQIRLNPQPTAANVIAGDTITLYYSSLGTLLVNGSDIPGIPVQFHMALVYYCLADYWPRKEQDQRGQLYYSRFNEMVKDAKSLLFNANAAGQYAITDDDSDSLAADYLN